MATPHVAGAAALYLTAKPGSSPATVASGLVSLAVSDKITDPKGSPNKLLNVTGASRDSTEAWNAHLWEVKR